jgi:hypothetical protein
VARIAPPITINEIIFFALSPVSTRRRAPCIKLGTFTPVCAFASSDRLHACARCCGRKGAVIQRPSWSVREGEWQPSQRRDGADIIAVSGQFERSAG